MKIDLRELLTYQGILTIVALISNLIVAALGATLHSKVGGAIIFLNVSFLVLLFSESEHPMSILLSVAMALSICIMLMGMLFKINHWPWANVMMILGAGAMMIVYRIRYAKKKKKVVMDMIKLIWVQLTSLSILYTMLHWGRGDFIRLAAGLSLIAMQFYYLYTLVLIPDDADTEGQQ